MTGNLYWGAVFIAYQERTSMYLFTLSLARGKAQSLIDLQRAPSASVSRTLGPPLPDSVLMDVYTSPILKCFCP